MRDCENTKLAFCLEFRRRVENASRISEHHIKFIKCNVFKYNAVILKKRAFVKEGLDKLVFSYFACFSKIIFGRGENGIHLFTFHLKW